MDKMEFKKLEIQPEGSWVKRTLLSQHGKKTLLYIGLGAVAGLMLYLLSKENPISNISIAELAQNMFFGGFFGFFITNSPCARGKC
ncbi:hypothetical protein [Sunxiuqinia indica]|uniref:hypothetical protein n=1 Tax=Sunxiuqinia indica TaxID=2692584 RepID=UPI00135B5207|nr:hypothetical protein [Sunxiuqinia indica]